LENPLRFILPLSIHQHIPVESVAVGDGKKPSKRVKKGRGRSKKKNKGAMIVAIDSTKGCRKTSNEIRIDDIDKKHFSRMREKQKGAEIDQGCHRVWSACEDVA